ASELLLFDMTSEPARPRLAMASTTRAIMTSMSVMPRAAVRRLVFKTAPPEEPAEQAGGCRAATVDRGAHQGAGAAAGATAQRREPQDSLVGDDDHVPGRDVQHRRPAS